MTGEIPSRYGGGDLADMLSTWVPDAALRKQVLVENQARLYEFK